MSVTAILPRLKQPPSPGSSFGLRHDIQPHSVRALVLNNLGAGVGLDEVEGMVSAYGKVRMVNIEFVPPPRTPTIIEESEVGSVQSYPTHASASTMTSPSRRGSSPVSHGMTTPDLTLSQTSSRSSTSAGGGGGETFSPILLTPVLTLESEDGEVIVLSGGGESELGGGGGGGMSASGVEAGLGVDIGSGSGNPNEDGSWATFSKLMGGLSLTGRRRRSLKISPDQVGSVASASTINSTRPNNIGSTATATRSQTRGPDASTYVDTIPVLPDEEADGLSLWRRRRSSARSIGPAGKSIAYIYFKNDIQASKALDCLQVTFMNDQTGRTAKWDRLPLW